MFAPTDGRFDPTLTLFVSWIELTVLRNMCMEWFGIAITHWAQYTKISFICECWPNHNQVPCRLILLCICMCVYRHHGALWELSLFILTLHSCITCWESTTQLGCALRAGHHLQRIQQLPSIPVSPNMNTHTSFRNWIIQFPIFNQHIPKYLIPTVLLV